MNSEYIYIKFNAYIKKNLYYTKISYINKNINTNNIQFDENIHYLHDDYFNENKLIEKICISEVINQNILTEKQKLILDFYYNKGINDIQISNILGSSKQAINKIRHQAIKKIKKSINQDY